MVGNAAAGGALSVPTQAVVRQAGKTYVFVCASRGFAPCAGQLGAQGDGGWAVKSGLKPGDEVAVAGMAALKGAWLGLGAEGK